MDYVKAAEPVNYKIHFSWFGSLYNRSKCIRDMLKKNKSADNRATLNAGVYLAGKSDRLVST